MLFSVDYSDTRFTSVIGVPHRQVQFRGVQGSDSGLSLPEVSAAASLVPLHVKVEHSSSTDLSSVCEM